jgi:hypothetical protein
VLKALNDLYKYKQVKRNESLNNSDVIRFLMSSLNILYATGKYIHISEGYETFYENHYLNSFTQYYKFLIDNNLLKPQSRFEEEDIVTLMRIKSWRENGTLEELREQIIKSDESQRGVSLMFFRNEKYLDNKPSLLEALKTILDVEHFSNEKDQQYIYKLECNNPVVIVLCENLDLLTKPNKPRQHGVELWYVGGKNVNKLNYADTRGIPIYYSADWDQDGIFVIYPLVVKIIPSIRILTPNGPPKGIIETAHNSLWSPNFLDLLNSSSELFTAIQKNMILSLVESNCWIIEESNDLITMLSNR